MEMTIFVDINAIGYMKTQRAKLIGIARHRFSIDGEGVTTLVAFHGCPLCCRYCLNPQSLGDDRSFREYTPEALYDEVRIDELYFLATNGGVTFGGGEPCLRPGFIHEFRELCGPAWQISLETSLNVPAANIRTLLPVADKWIIDIKDMNTDIYRSYTKKDNGQVLDNLRFMAEANRQDDCMIRLPLIPEFNVDADRTSSRMILEELGFKHFDLFTYKIRNNDYDKRKTDLQDSERDTQADSRG